MLLGAALILGVAWGIEATNYKDEKAQMRSEVYCVFLGLFIEGPDMMIKSTMATRLGQHHSLHSNIKVDIRAKTFYSAGEVAL